MKKIYIVGDSLDSTSIAMRQAQNEAYEQYGKENVQIKYVCRDGKPTEIITPTETYYSKCILADCEHFVSANIDEVRFVGDLGRKLQQLQVNLLAKNGKMIFGE